VAIRVAINGFGRIGRLVLRAIAERKRQDIQVVAINDLGSVSVNAHLFQYDSVHGAFPGEVIVSNNTMNVGLGEIHVLSEEDPNKLPWKDLNVDVTLECTGRFANRQDASQHIKAGAQRVLISAPASNVDQTIVYGVNHKTLKTSDTIVSNASCTTNCLVPFVYVLHNSIGINSGFMTTIHAYTADQRLVDSTHNDLRRARAAALSMVPTSTGAARAVGLIIPELKGKLDGTAIRVPTANVSLIDLKFNSNRATSINEINDIISKSSKDDLQHILGVVEAPLVSSDFNHNPLSSIFDLTQTHVVDNTFCRVLAWYDNEWGFANRMSDTAVYMANLN
jgi:glyceraldehyde 3-phosphate dehydrogenase